MAFIEMYSELTGCLPKLPVDYAKTLVNRARADIYRKNLWSFQLFEANWVSPGLLNSGTVTTTIGSNQIVFDATASAAITALPAAGSFPTGVIQRQFRIGIGTIYNIWAYAVDGGGIVTLTLDRQYAEPSGSGQAYTILQCYYAAPMEDFLTFINVRDMVNFNDLNLYSNRKQVDQMDPQRTIFYLPTYVVGYQQDQNPDSATYRWPMSELWGVPSYVLTYQLYGIRKGVPLVEDGDQLPPAIGEDAVMALARSYAYEWAEATKGDMPRNSGSDFRFLMRAAMDEYSRLARDYRRQDRELVDSWFEIRKRPVFFTSPDGYYNAIGNSASPGAPW